MTPMISMATLSAYQRTRYCVRADIGDIVLRVGQRSEPLHALQQAHGVDCCALITACNRFGRMDSADVNMASMRALHAHLEGTGHVLLPTEAHDDGGAWPVEHGVLVLGLERAAARALCVRFEQNAVLVCMQDATPFLALHPQALVTS